jgi:methylated-DNA-[protein]-cysteine S-methyltransferase
MPAAWRQAARAARGRAFRPGLAALDKRRLRVCHPASIVSGQSLRDVFCQDFAAMPQLSLHSPIGDLTLSEDAGALVALDWGWGRDQEETPLLRHAADLLQAYFDGVMPRAGFRDLPLAPPGTAFQRGVWEELRRIPPGETRSYGDLARAMQSSARAVGQANGANPIPILIPCHRVVAQHGLGGYSAPGGIETKSWLLAFERRAIHPLSCAQTGH